MCSRAIQLYVHYTAIECTDTYQIYSKATSVGLAANVYKTKLELLAATAAVYETPGRRVWRDASQQKTHQRYTFSSEIF